MKGRTGGSLSQGQEEMRSPLPEPTDLLHVPMSSWLNQRGDKTIPRLPSFLFFLFLPPLQSLIFSSVSPNPHAPPPKIHTEA